MPPQRAPWHVCPWWNLSQAALRCPSEFNATCTPDDLVVSMCVVESEPGSPKVSTYLGERAPHAESPVVYVHVVEDEHISS